MVIWGVVARCFQQSTKPMCYLAVLAMDQISLAWREQCIYAMDQISLAWREQCIYAGFSRYMLGHMKG
jgi:hypothetical protein